MTDRFLPDGSAGGRSAGSSGMAGRCSSGFLPGGRCGPGRTPPCRFLLRLTRFRMLRSPPGRAPPRRLLLCRLRCCTVFCRNGLLLCRHMPPHISIHWLCEKTLRNVVIEHRSAPGPAVPADGTQGSVLQTGFRMITDTKLPRSVWMPRAALQTGTILYHPGRLFKGGRMVPALPEGQRKTAELSPTAHYLYSPVIPSLPQARRSAFASPGTHREESGVPPPSSG